MIEMPMALHSTRSLNAARRFSKLNFVQLRNSDDLQCQALRAIAPNFSPARWRCAEVTRTPKSVVTVHEVSLTEGEAQPLTNDDHSIVFVEKRSILKSDVDLYRDVQAQVGEFIHMPTVFFHAELKNKVASRYRYAVFSEFVTGRTVRVGRPADAKLLANALAKINQMELNVGRYKGLEYEGALRKLQSARDHPRVRALHSAAEWDSVDRRLAELIPSVLSNWPRMRPAHGDIHTQNILFSDSGNNPGIQIIDWEWISCRPVGTDLHSYYRRSILYPQVLPFYLGLVNEYARRMINFGVSSAELELATLCAALWNIGTSLTLRSNDAQALHDNRIVLNETIVRLQRLAGS